MLKNNLEVHDVKSKPLRAKNPRDFIISIWFKKNYQ